MTFMWLYIAIITTVISAFSIILNKKQLNKSISPQLLTWVTIVIATPIIFAVTIKNGIPKTGNYFLIGVIISVLFYISSRVLQFKAISISDLSNIYPLVAIGPIFTVIISIFPPLREQISLITTVGVLTTLFGVYILNFDKMKITNLTHPFKVLFYNKASLLMIISVLLDSFIMIFDKIAINDTFPQNSNYVLLVENIIVILIMMPTICIKEKSFIHTINLNLFSLLLIGILNATTTILAFYTIGSGNVGIFAVILRSQLLFVLLFSYLFFKDKPRPTTIIGSIIIITGVIFIRLGM